MPKNSNHSVHKGDRVRVRGCSGTARVDKCLRKYGVILLDRQMFRRHTNGEGSDPYYAGYWTYPAADLTKVGGA